MLFTAVDENELEESKVKGEELSLPEPETVPAESEFTPLDDQKLANGDAACSEASGDAQTSQPDNDPMSVTLLETK